jgi:hypothetical protein
VNVNEYIFIYRVRNTFMSTSSEIDGGTWYEVWMFISRPYKRISLVRQQSVSPFNKHGWYTVNISWTSYLCIFRWNHFSHYDLILGTAQCNDARNGHGWFYFLDSTLGVPRNTWFGQYVVASKCSRNLFISEKYKIVNKSCISFKIVPLCGYTFPPATVIVLETFLEAIL